MKTEAGLITKVCFERLKTDGNTINPKAELTLYT